MPKDGDILGLTLGAFLATHGGVRDEGGELKAIGADEWHKGKPFQKRLVSDAGMSIDAAGELAGQNTGHGQFGYFPELQGGRPEVRDVLDALGDEMRGKPRYLAPDADQQKLLDRRDMALQVEQALLERGIDVKTASNEEIKAALTGPELHQPMSPADYETMLADQRSAEGLTAALRDPETGKVYEGKSHSNALNEAAKAGDDALWQRLHDAWDARGKDVGYIDAKGKFITEAEAERRSSSAMRTYRQGGQTKIADVLAAVDEKGDAHKKAVLGGTSDWLAAEAEKRGIDVQGFRHTLDTAAARHILSRHGDAATEKSRGQLVITHQDLSSISEVLAAPDHLVFGAKNKRGQDLVGYIKKQADGSTLLVEEVRTGRKEMAIASMRKYPATALSDNIAATLEPNGRTDGGDKLDIVDAPANVTALEPDKGGQQFDQPARGSITLGEGRTMIRLFRDANLSTFSHEMAHLYLKQMLGDALREDAPQALRDDVGTVRKYLGMAEDQVAPTREQHELFARSWETYLMEGKAPSAELRMVFQKFSAWLTRRRWCRGQSIRPRGQKPP